MFGKINGMFLQGLEGMHVLVEADVSDGLPGYSFVGVLASEVKEAQDRVRTAIRNLHVSLPPKKVTINLSPADIRKEGTGFDMPIAVAILSAYGLVIPGITEGAVFIGELGLDGKVKGVPGILALTDWAKKSGYQRLFLPMDNIREAAVIEEIELVGIENLNDLFDMLQGKRRIEPWKRRPISTEFELNNYDVDFSEVNGQRVLRRAAEVAVSGNHNLLMIGPPGSGKTMIAKRMPTILPRLKLEECIEMSKIYSVVQMLDPSEPLISRRPFRAPHYSITAQALTGGGVRPKPGEISLATGGILFLDEIGEAHRESLQGLRTPLEEKVIRIARVNGTYTYPADFLLVAATNPCPCGHFPSTKCTCSPWQVRRYLSKISRPLLDRIDICVEANQVTFDEITRQSDNEPSVLIRERVEACREIQEERYKNTNIRCNSEMNSRQIKEFCHINKEESQFMKDVFREMQLSARMYDKILKIARTTADMEGRVNVEHKDLCEAISYVRVRERYWGQ